MGEFRFTFWGTRGSIACPSPDHLRYGGNTSCIHVEVGGGHMILDAGTGIRDLGKKLSADGVTEAVILLTHTHWDHINGFPFFGPAFQPGHTFRIMAGHLRESGGVKSALEGQMAQPLFPVPLNQLKSTMNFVDFDAGEQFSDVLPGVNVKTQPLNHPSGATGYRIESQGKSLCYVTDTEHTIGSPDQNILKLIAGADIVIYDCTYSDDEFASHVGWGHSTWQEGVRLCQQAGAKKLVIFHHDPDHNDEVMDDIAKQAKSMWDQTVVAQEGMTIDMLSL